MKKRIRVAIYKADVDARLASETAQIELSKVKQPLEVAPAITHMEILQQPPSAAISPMPEPIVAQDIEATSPPPPQTNTNPGPTYKYTYKRAPSTRINPRRAIKTPVRTAVKEETRVFTSILELAAAKQANSKKEAPVEKKAPKPVPLPMFDLVLQKIRSENLARGQNKENASP